MGSEHVLMAEDCVRLVVPGVLYLDLRFAPALDEGYNKVKALAAGSMCFGLEAL